MLHSSHTHRNDSRHGDTRSLHRPGRTKPAGNGWSHAPSTGRAEDQYLDGFFPLELCHADEEYFLFATPPASTPYQTGLVKSHFDLPAGLPMSWPSKIFHWWEGPTVNYGEPSEVVALQGSVNRVHAYLGMVLDIWDAEYDLPWKPLETDASGEEGASLLMRQYVGMEGEESIGETAWTNSRDLIVYNVTIQEYGKYLKDYGTLSVVGHEVGHIIHEIYAGDVHAWDIPETCVDGESGEVAKACIEFYIAQGTNEAWGDLLSNIAANAITPQVPAAFVMFGKKPWDWNTPLPLSATQKTEAYAMLHDTVEEKFLVAAAGKSEEVSFGWSHDAGALFKEWVAL